MEEELLKETITGEETQSANEEGTKDEYVPRNAIVKAKESLYSKVKVSVREVDLFIGGCCALIILFVVFGLLMR